jgi:anaerobic ribonucleoside-triphosphate reductase activating protein
MMNIDVLVDGKYIEGQADAQLKYRGSKNQRIIDVPRSIKLKKIQILQM